MTTTQKTRPALPHPIPVLALLVVIGLSVSTNNIFVLEPSSPSNRLLNSTAHPESNANPIPIFPDRDTYVEMGNPTSNFGGQDYLYIGDSYNDLCFSYVHFNFTEKPASFAKAYLSLKPGVLTETMNLSLNLMDSTETWEELTMTYLTRPTTIIDHIEYRVAEESLCWIDITPFFTQNSLTDLSVMINASLLHDEYTYMTTYQKEMGGSSLFPPISLTFVEAGDAIDFSAEDYVPENNEIVPSKDTYIDSDNGLSNFGGLDDLKFGTGLFDNLYATILHFDQIPTDTSLLSLNLDINGVDETMEFYITIFTAENGMQAWEEVDLTWITWPYPSVVTLMQGENVNLTKIVASSGDVTIDLAPWIGNDTLDIILTLPLLTEDYLYCGSYEGASWLYEPPKLIIDPQTVNTQTSSSTSSGTSSSTTDGTNANVDGETIPGFPVIGLLGIVVLSIGRIKRKDHRLRS